MRTASFTLAVAALAATTSLAVHLDTEPHLEADLDLETAVDSEDFNLFTDKRVYYEGLDLTLKMALINKYGLKYKNSLDRKKQKDV